MGGALVDPGAHSPPHALGLLCHERSEGWRVLSTVHCALHNSADHFPNASPVIGGSVTAAPDAASVTCRFEGYQ